MYVVTLDLRIQRCGIEAEEPGGAGIAGTAANQRRSPRRHRHADALSAMELLAGKLKKTKPNAEFLMSMNVG